MPTRALVTGASGYIGGRLIPALLDAGVAVRAAGRDRRSLEHRTWSERVEIAETDLQDRAAVRRALEDVDAVVFLVHAMGGGKGYADREAEMARIMAEESARAGVGRIVYLSGLHPELPEDELSEHMASRERVAQILSEGEVPALVLQAATIIGGGSASFEIIRHLADRLAVMPAPSWVSNRIEPLAVDDVLHHLVAGVTVEKPIDGAFAVGSGESHLRFADLLTVYADVAGLARRRVLALPVPAPKLSGLWIALVTPVPRQIAMPLAESMQHEAVSHGRTIDEVLDPPAGGATPYRAAVGAALASSREAELAQLEDPWRAQSLGPAAVQPSDPDWAGIPRREISVARPDADTARSGAALGRLVTARSSALEDLAGTRRPWTLETSTAEGATAHVDTSREGRLWLAVTAGSSGRLRLVAAPEGVMGRALWWARRPRRAAALRALADALDEGTDGSVDPTHVGP